VLSEHFANEAEGVAATVQNSHCHSHPLRLGADAPIHLPRKAGEEKKNRRFSATATVWAQFEN
jgi:hypothetical protein